MKNIKGANFLTSRDNNSNHYVFPELVKKSGNTDGYKLGETRNIASMFSPPTMQSKKTTMFTFDNLRPKSKIRESLRVQLLLIKILCILILLYFQSFR